MAKFVCVCGYRLSTSGDIPNPDEWQVISDVDLEPLLELGALDVYKNSTFMYRCPVSDHLWFFWEGWDGPRALYTPTPLPDGWQ